MTDLRKLLGIELPVIQAPMAGSQGSALAIAVSGAGALGSLPCALLAPDAMRRELEAIATRCGRACNVNFLCHAPPVPDAERETRWRMLLAPYYREFGLDPADTQAGPGRAPFSAEVADILDEFRPAVVSFHFGLPAPELLARVRRWDARVLSSATTLDEARWLERHGVDAVIAQGLEAGGHRGHFLGDDPGLQKPALELLASIVKEVRVPVIAAGGIATADDVAAAMRLGAAGVQIGTAYLLCPESSTSDVHRAALSGPGAGRTALTNLFSGRPARGIVNRLMREIGPLSTSAPAFPLAAAAVAPLRAAAESRGSGDFSPLWCGSVPPLRNGVAAADLTRELASGLPN